MELVGVVSTNLSLGLIVKLLNNIKFPEGLLLC